MPQFPDLTNALGADIDIGSGDMALDPNNDVQLVTGMALLSQRFYRRLATNPGELLWHPAYGAGLQGYVDNPLSQHKLSELTLLIQDQLAKDPIVSSVDSVILTQGDNNGLIVDFTVVLIDTLAQLPVTIAIAGNMPGA